MPNDTKLKVNLIKKNDSISYCCQCSWISIANKDFEKNIKEIKQIKDATVDKYKGGPFDDIITFGGNLQWSCMGHNV